MRKHSACQQRLCPNAGETVLNESGRRPCGEASSKERHGRKKESVSDVGEGRLDLENVCGDEERVVGDVWDGGDGSTQREMRSGIAGIFASQSQLGNLIITSWQCSRRCFARPLPILSSSSDMSSTKVKKSTKPPALSMQGMSSSSKSRGGCL